MKRAEYTRLLVSRKRKKKKKSYVMYCVCRPISAISISFDKISAFFMLLQEEIHLFWTNH